MAAPVSNNLSQRFQAVFEEASRSTGANFDYLVRTAQRESGLNAAAKAPTSSATGLFQFIEQTWLGTMKESGPSLGFSNAARHIEQVGDKYYVKDPQVREQILDLRKDPKASALLAGAYARKNEAILEQRLNRPPSSGELYAAHFLGANGSGQLIELAEERPNLDAYKIFPAQARANRAIFFDKSGNAKSVSEVYDNLVATVPTQKKPLSRFFNLGEWFKPKASMQESRFASKAVDAVATQSQLPKPKPLTVEEAATVARFFNEPAEAVATVLPSRYGMSYSPSEANVTAPRASRFSVGEAGQQVIAAQPEFRNSRLLSDGTTALPQASVPLPRRKPVTADLYVEALGSLLPKPKPSPIDLVGDVDERAVNSSTQPSGIDEQTRIPERRGALDLSVFLTNDVFSSRKKA